ncbi:MAG: phosphoribosylformylglycinamidine cyclo-ligase [Chloroflexota bacterium]|nr:phosphoribosylformylglycinamidine cyclo-ligase [Chloroflexota bacterium]
MPGDERAPAYTAAGVDIAAGEQAVTLMRAAVRATFGPAVLADVGHFGGLYSLAGVLGQADGPANPVLVASADGVGTKLRLALAAGRHDTIGADLVNHCVNDILACGARPLFFLDYFAGSKLDPAQVATVVGGLAGACRAVGCALLGGETAEMPGFYAAGDYDLAGFIVGMVLRGRMILGSAIAPGDVVLGLPAAGLHTNGYSLARRALGLDDAAAVVIRARLDETPPGWEATLGEVLLLPHRCYLPAVAPLLDGPEGPLVRGMAHITGGGLPGNIARILPPGTAVALDPRAWTVPPIFALIAERGGIAAAEMPHVFNMGLGFILIAAPAQVAAIQALAPAAQIVGRVTARTGDDPAVTLGDA